MGTNWVGKSFTVIALVAGLAGTAVADGKTKAELRREAVAKRAAAKAAAKAKVKAFKLRIKGAREPEIFVSALRDLSEMHHKDVLKTIASYLRHPFPEVADEAATALAEVGKALSPKERHIAVKMVAPGLRLGKKKPDLAISAINSLVRMGDPAHAPQLFGCMDCKELRVATAAIDALGKLPNKFSVDRLLKSLAKVDIAPVGGGGSAYQSSGGNASGNSPGAGAAARNEAIKSASNKALKAITGQTFTSSSSWKRWWKKNKAKFKVKVAKNPAKGTKN